LEKKKKNNSKNSNETQDQGTWLSWIFINGGSGGKVKSRLLKMEDVGGLEERGNNDQHHVALNKFSN